MHSQQVRVAGVLGSAEGRAIILSPHPCVRGLPNLRRYTRHVARCELQRWASTSAATSYRSAYRCRCAGVVGNSSTPQHLHRRACAPGDPSPRLGSGLGCPQYEMAYRQVTSASAAGAAFGWQPLRVLPQQRHRWRLSRDARDQPGRRCGRCDRSCSRCLGARRPAREAPAPTWLRLSSPLSTAKQISPFTGPSDHVPPITTGTLPVPWHFAHFALLQICRSRRIRCKFALLYLASRVVPRHLD